MLPSDSGDVIRLALLTGSTNDGGELLGVLSLIGDGPFRPDATEPARAVARVAAAFLAGFRDRRRHEEQLLYALEGRDVIGQAKGILMAESNVDADSAFRMLVRASQRENRKLRDLAADIVARRGLSTARQQ